MNLQEELYSNTPPSLKIKEVQPFLEAEKSCFWQLLADFIFENMLKNKFAAIRVKNLENLNKRDFNKPNILYAPHICWWDGILEYYLGRKVFNLDMIGMMEDLHSMPVLRKIGAFSVDKKSVKVVKNSIDFAVKSLNYQRKSLFLFPQGIIRPQDYMPLEFSSGISYVASKLDGVNLIPLAIRYCFLRSSSPEILIEVSDPIFLPKVENIKETTQKIQENFSKTLEKQRIEIASCNLEGYKTVLKQKENLIELFLKHCRKKFKTKQ